MSKTIYLNRNENLYGPAPKCFEVLKKVKPDLLISNSEYFSNKITPKLAKMFKISEKQIILGYGSEDIITMIFDSFINKGDFVLAPKIGWRFYDMQIKRKRGRKAEIQINKLSDAFEYDVENLIHQYKSKKPKLVIITSPNMPTGNSISFDGLEKFLKITDKKTIVLLDEAYCDFVKNYNQKRLVSLLKQYDNLMATRTFSKLYALAGLRVAFALCGRNIKQMLNFEESFVGFNRLSEEIVVAALNSKAYYKELKEKFICNRKLVTESVNYLNGWKAYKSDGNFILIEFPGEYKSKFKKLLEKNNLIVRFFDEPRLYNSLRFSLGREKENKLFLNLIGQLIKN